MQKTKSKPRSSHKLAKRAAQSTEKSTAKNNAPSRSRPSEDLMLSLCPFPSKEVALPLLKRLLEKGLIVCAHFGPEGFSQYLWKGKVEQASETWIWIKHLQKHHSTLSKEVLRHHPYEIPAILTFKVDQTNPSFLAWARNLGKSVT